VAYRLQAEVAAIVHRVEKLPDQFGEVFRVAQLFHNLADRMREDFAQIQKVLLRRRAFREFHFAPLGDKFRDGHMMVVVGCEMNTLTGHA
jgi:hypothetical protein